MPTLLLITVPLQALGLKNLIVYDFLIRGERAWEGGEPQAGWGFALGMPFLHNIAHYLGV
jgi:hypothetical protein